MNICANCKYWGNGWTALIDKINECGKIGLAESNSKEAAFIDVQVSDDSGLNARLMTVANFSCPLHRSI